MTGDWIIVVALTVALVASVPGFAALLRLGRAGMADTYATMEGTLSRMSSRLDALEQEGEQDRQTISALTKRVRELEHGIEILIDQLEQANIPPAWMPNGTVMVSVPIRPQELAQRIRAAFNVDEMDDLAMRIGLNPEDIKGDTATRRARELVDSANRNSVLGLLIETCKELRPRSKWQ